MSIRTILNIEYPPQQVSEASTAQMEPWPKFPDLHKHLRIIDMKEVQWSGSELGLKHILGGSRSFAHKSAKLLLLYGTFSLEHPRY